MNKIILIGRLCKQPEVRYSPNNADMEICSFTLAVNRMKKDEADFITCKAFGKTAEFIGKYFAKGSQIALEGRIQTGKYDNKEGKTVYMTDVVVDRCEFVGVKKEQQGDAAEPPEQTRTNESRYVSDDIDLPF